MSKSLNNLWIEYLKKQGFIFGQVDVRKVAYYTSKVVGTPKGLSIGNLEAQWLVENSSGAPGMSLANLWNIFFDEQGVASGDLGSRTTVWLEGEIALIPEASFVMTVGEMDTNVYGFSYNHPVNPAGSVVPRAGFVSGSPAIAFDQLQASTSNDNLSIQFTSGLSLPTIQIEGATQVVVSISVYSAVAPWRAGIDDYFISGDNIAGFGDAMKAQLGKEMSVTLSWIPVP